MKYYVVCWMENDEVKSKTFKYRKAAEKFGCKMMYKYHTSVDIATWIDTEHIITENYN